MQGLYDIITWPYNSINKISVELNFQSEFQTSLKFDEAITSHASINLLCQYPYVICRYIMLWNTEQHIAIEISRILKMEALYLHVQINELIII